MQQHPGEGTRPQADTLADYAQDESESMAPWPDFDDEEREAVDRILRSGRVNYWTGDECLQFEREFAEYHGVSYAVALANGTLALELALKVLGIGAGDEVIVTPRSYFASASCVAVQGATPVFADVDSNSQNVTARSISAALTERTKSIIAVHLAGWPCDMPAIMELARMHGLSVIEDCAQAHGARIGGQLVGSFGDLAAFSFCQDKIMSTAGEGGMLLTNTKKYWSAAWSYKDHGKSWDTVYASEHPPGFRWLHESFGSNWRMTEIQGAIGRLQLRKVDRWIEQRQQNAAFLNEQFADIGALRLTIPPPEISHSYYKYYAFVRPELLGAGWSRDRILAELQNVGAPGLSGSCPEIYREKAFSGQNYAPRLTAKALGETSLMLPVHPTLKQRDLVRMSRAVRSILAFASE